MPKTDTPVVGIVAIYSMLEFMSSRLYFLQCNGWGLRYFVSVSHASLGYTDKPFDILMVAVNSTLSAMLSSQYATWLHHPSSLWVTFGTGKILVPEVDTICVSSNISEDDLLTRMKQMYKSTNSFFA